MLSTETLVSYATELEETTPGSGLAWLMARRAEALAKMNGGNSSHIITTTVNGETYTRQLVASANEWLDALQAAIDDMRGLRTRISYGRFDCIPH